MKPKCVLQARTEQQDIQELQETQEPLDDLAGLDGLDQQEDQGTMVAPALQDSLDDQVGPICRFEIMVA